jgi:hypothetical protein
MTDPRAEQDALFVERDGEQALVVRDVDRLRPFLVSVVSAADHWLFMSSRGAVTLGRGHAENNLLPYETDDRLHANAGIHGPLTLVRVSTRDGGAELWRPFAGACGPERRRQMFKAPLGDWVELEEIAHDLGLTFRWRWSLSPRYGFVRRAWLTRHSAALRVEQVEVLDGLVGVAPAGVSLHAQQALSTLVDAYKRSELDRQSGLALYTLEATLSDRAQAVESLRANVIWHRGLSSSAAVSLSDELVEPFCRGEAVVANPLALGRRGAYLLGERLQLDEGQTARWQLIADVGLDHVAVEELRAEVSEPGGEIAGRIAADVADNHRQLAAIVASADGQQLGADRRAVVHHSANTLFNAMRGGVFADNGLVPIEDFRRFVARRNRRVAERHDAALRALAGAAASQPLASLRELGERADDADLQRLIFEYLPLYFSRRHGDPSRPWNRFSIRLGDQRGERRLAYEGNWRDIFQNWEPLLASFPAYHLSVIAKFVNASTADGHNPYRISDEGIDWEVPDPDDPWAYIGYWGDHQVAYLLRLLQSCEAHQPGALLGLLPRRLFSYADVPYRIAPYAKLLVDPKSTISFDERAAGAVAKRCSQLGADGKLLADASGGVLHVTLAEKLIVPALAKLSNLVADGGIWLNTQRPEWNDANNALVGQGLSMVTLCYLRSYLAFCGELFEELAEETPQVQVSREVASWLEVVCGELADRGAALDTDTVDDRTRRQLLDAVGAAYSRYRERIYEGGPGAPLPLAVRALTDLCDSALPWLDHAIAANRTDDGLLHSYNLVTLESDEARVDHTYEMLEGQVALLASGLLDAEQTLGLLSTMERGPLYREDQQTYMLYPQRELPSFLDRNRVSAEQLASSPLLSALVQAGDRSLISRDVTGGGRFAAELTTTDALDEALDALAREPAHRALVDDAERARVHQVYEQVFGHHGFTGRSGTMYKYEGIGSIYWHMVAKLLLAVQEGFWRLDDLAPEHDTRARKLASAYYHLRAGLGVDKSPEVYGAFPTDPYSHSPAHLGAQQPGMTGQVKEGVLLRRGELGVRVAGGAIDFMPRLLREEELLAEPSRFRYVDIEGVPRELELDAGTLAFTVCQVPVVYTLTAEHHGSITIRTTDDETQRSKGTRVAAPVAAGIFARDGSVSRLDIEVPRSWLALHDKEATR